MSKIINVCLDHSPTRGGSYTSVNDFAFALGSDIIDFNYGLGLPAKPPHGVKIQSFKTCDNILAQHHAYIPKEVKLRAEALCCNADLLICHGFFRSHANWVHTMHKKYGIPYWVVPHGVLDPFVIRSHSLHKKLWLSLLGSPVLKDSARIIFASSLERKRAQKWSTRSQDQTISWPLNISFFGLRTSVRDGFRAKLGLPKCHRLLLYFGRYHSSKAPIETIRAFFRAKPKQTSLVMVGIEDPISVAALRNAAEAIGCENIYIMGPLFGQDKIECLFACDGFISMSKKENFGYAVAEALAVGLPVILTPGIGLAYDLRGVKCGWLLENYKERSASNAISDFDLAQQEELSAFGEAGMLWAHANLKPDVFKSRIRELANTDSLQRGLSF